MPPPSSRLRPLRASTLTRSRPTGPRLIGLVTPDLQNAIFPAITEAVGSELTRRGFTPVLCSQSRGGGSEPAFVEFLLRRRFAGIVFTGGHYAFTDAPHAHYGQLARLSVPVTLFNAGVAHLPFPRVVCDDAAATDLGWRHLASLGHERIGLVLGPYSHLPSERKAARARELGVDPALVVRTSFSLEAGQAVAGDLFSAGATGLLCASDPLALGVIRAARRRGLDVPGDVSVVGYDDSALMRCTSPPLTTVRQPVEAMAAVAVDLLCAQMDAPSASAHETPLEPELIVRESTGRPRPRGAAAPR
ncbi:substrate-binding domain-containing protein [Streptomyces sp. NPDC048330]|uniref:substrate-binding domain-containing protein n=1 Tax=Streptomyces sp. NPDC048330 TaxID=3365533 RepID=UPI0037129894